MKASASALILKIKSGAQSHRTFVHMWASSDALLENTIPGKWGEIERKPAPIKLIAIFN